MDKSTTWPRTRTSLAQCYGMPIPGQSPQSDGKSITEWRSPPTVRGAMPNPATPAVAALPGSQITTTGVLAVGPFVDQAFGYGVSIQDLGPAIVAAGLQCTGPFINTAGQDGFDLEIRAGLSTGTGNASRQVLFGLTDAPIGTAAISALSRSLGFGYDAADTEIFLFNRPSAAAVVKTPTGLPKTPAAAADPNYWVRIFKPPGVPAVFAKIVHLPTGLAFEHLIEGYTGGFGNARPSTFGNTGGVASSIGIFFGSLKYIRGSDVSF